MSVGYPHFKVGDDGGTCEESNVQPQGVVRPLHLHSIVLLGSEGEHTVHLPTSRAGNVYLDFPLAHHHGAKGVPEGILRFVVEQALSGPVCAKQARGPRCVGAMVGDDQAQMGDQQFIALRATDFRPLLLAQLRENCDVSDRSVGPTNVSQLDSSTHERG